MHVPFWVGAGAVVLAAVGLALGRRHLSGVDLHEEEDEVERREDEAELATVADG